MQKSPSNIKNLLKKKLILSKKVRKTNHSPKTIKEYELAVKNYHLKYEKYFCTNPNLKTFYSYGKSKIKLNTSLPSYLITIKTKQ